MNVGARFCMLLVNECNTVSQPGSRESGKDIPGLKEGTCVVMAPSGPHCPSSVSSCQC